MTNNATVESMQPIGKFLARLRRMNLRLWSEDGRLRVSGPPGVLTSELRQEITTRKKEILNFLGEVREATTRPPIERVPRDQPLPLSFAQERLWRNERKAASTDNINVIVLDMIGDLKIPCLERSIQELVRRHEVFRTTFHLMGDAPVQRIAPPGPIELNLVDLGHFPDPAGEATRFAHKEKTDFISLDQGPLIRFSLLRFGAQHHRLVIKLHHILYDIWSLPIFRRELDTLYGSFCSGQNSPLEELAVQPADYAVWQRRYLAPGSSSFRLQLAYWKKQLSGNLPVLRLPCERPCELQTASIEDVLAPFEMSEELSAKIRDLTRKEGTTLFVTFLTGIKALINLTTGQNDIMLGAYMAKRNAPEADRMMGFFADVGPLRTRVSSELSFLELICQVRDTVFNAQAHEDMPFELVSAELKKCGQTPPDIRAIFMVESFSGQTHRLGDLEIRPIRIETRKAMPWRFQMRVREGRRAFNGRAKFDARVHNPHLVRRMVRNYVRLLNAVVTRPAMRLCDVEDELDGW